MARTNILKLENIWFAYEKGKYVLKDISLSILKGDKIGIVGPNGSGKTTLIKHLNGLLSPEKGRIFYNGYEVKKRRELTRHVGLVFQNPEDQVFFPIVEEDIAFGPRNQGLKEEEVFTRVKEAMEYLKITHLAKRSFFSLSFGEKKKVSIAGVLAMRPEIMVLDEPTLGFDPWSKKEFLEIIDEVSKRSAIVITTHDLEVLDHVNRIIMIMDGQIKEEFVDKKEFMTKVFEHGLNEK